MASETDVKTRKNLSVALGKGNDIMGTLSEVRLQTDDPVVVESLRRVRGLSAALVVGLQHLETTVYDLWRAAKPRQLTLEDLLQSARRIVPEVREADDDAIGQAASMDLDEDEEEEEDALDAEPRMTALAAEEPDHSAGNVREFFKPPTAGTAPTPSETAGALAQAGREVSVHEIQLWTPGERQAAHTWARAKVDGRDVPPPEVVSRQYLEDLDLGEAQDLAMLLDEIGVPDTEEVEWGEDRESVVAWASALYRFGRGEKVEVPAVPELFVPEESLFGQIKAAVAAGPVGIGEIMDRFRPEDFGVRFAVVALWHHGEIAHHAVSGQYRVEGEAELQTTPAELSATARAIASGILVAGPPEEEVVEGAASLRAWFGNAGRDWPGDEVVAGWTEEDRLEVLDFLRAEADGFPDGEVEQPAVLSGAPAGADEEEGEEAAEEVEEVEGEEEE